MFIGSGIVAAAAATGTWYAMRDTGPDVTLINASTTENTENVDTSGIVEMVLGDDDAKVTLKEYASFTCPHCANFHETVYPDFKRDYIDTGKVKFVYRDVYFDRFGLWAAMIARCDPNRFFGIASLMYKQQKEWVGGESPAAIAENLRKIGRVAGLNNEQIEACLADEENAKALVAWSQANTAADDVNATPTLFINDVKHSNMNYSDLKKVLDEALEA
ncbi:thiol-disulfide oxidoreductase [Oceanicola sp. 22II-s10i]|uniref:DsbA family protein n=1 Tax=Oceanicola sp. 22II-s10i TaxID=1317116 RepID=UPI000B528F60|nr:DsbA family protein [Oceanicola sp. 22II-s10i]OWU86039.1 thiol-disulfide oxidoreductase [Oceanicola sp. 22II-s10i]